MSTRLAVAVATVAMGMAGSVVSNQANACALAGLRTTSASAQAQGAQFAAGISAAQQGRAASTSGPSIVVAPHASIVGFWKFAFTAPDGSSVDWGFQHWHDDGTEMTNSGSRPPEDGSFCMGVWGQHGRGSYNMNHWAIAYGGPPDFDPTVLAGLVNIHEQVNVDPSGNSMSGSFSEDLYAEDGTTFITHLGDGAVSGSRITP